MFYLKYRPQTISELDNERIRETLGKSLLNNDFAHAYLLIGTRGSGKTTTARLIAKIVNCTHRKKGEEPCNECESCLAVMNGSNLDVIEIDAASNTGVDDMRELREKVKLAPTASKFKVYIIDEVHMLSTSAFNALLKTLEEPPQHVIFVLATTDPQKIPETIKSRCLVYDFGKASKAEVVKSLERKVKSEKIKIGDKDLEMIAEKSDGSFRDADKLLEQFSKGEEVITSDKAGEAARRILETMDVSDVRDFVSVGGRVKDLILAMISELRLDMVEKPENIKLIEKLIEAHNLVRESPIPELPLEMVVVEFSPENSTVTSAKSVKSVTPVTTPEIGLDWVKVIETVKPKNNNLSALLRSARVVKVDGNYVIIEAFYKFHKDKLSEEKNRQVLEEVVSGILGRVVKVKFELKEV